MPNFAYSGRTRAGQTVSGERVADSMDAAVAALRRDQILVTRITPAKPRTEAAAKKYVETIRPYIQGPGTAVTASVAEAE